MEEPTTNLQPKNLLLWAGNEVRVGLGAMGTPKRVHQDIGVEECPQQAAKVDRQVSQTLWTHTQKKNRVNQGVTLLCTVRSEHLADLLLNCSTLLGLQLPRFSTL